MAKIDNLQDWVIAALEFNGGSASIVQVAEYIWTHHEKTLRAPGELFYTWRYDMRWACNRLRERKIIQSIATSKRGEWRLAP